MSSIRRNFTFFLKNDLDKTLDTLLHDDPTKYLDEKTYEKLMEPFSEERKRITKEEVCERFLNEASKQNTWSGALRALMVMHRIIHKLGFECYDPSTFGTSKKISKFSQFRAKDSVPSTLLHSPHVRYYYAYLQRLSYSYADFQVCFFPDAKLPESMTTDGLTFLNFITRLQNMLEYLVKFLPLFEVSLLQFSKLNIVRQLASFYLSDCYYFYTYINQALINLLGDFFKLGKEDAILLNEIYSEHIILTKKLKDCFQLSRYIEEFDVKIPVFYESNATFHYRVQTYIASLQKGGAPRMSLKDRRLIHLNWISSPEDTPNASKRDIQSMKGIKPILIHPTTNMTTADNSPVLRPPNSVRRKSEGPVVLPKIRIIKPKDKAPKEEVEVLYAVGHDPNPNLLKVPVVDEKESLNDSFYPTGTELNCRMPSEADKPKVTLLGSAF